MRISTPGNTLDFDVYRALQVGTSGTYRTTSNTDILAGTNLCAAVTGSANPGTYTGTLTITTSRQWNYENGYGLIDINAAVATLANGN